MEERNLAEADKQKPYFETVPNASDSSQDEGSREMGELYPFLISGGKNTERYYFTHIHDNTEYKFNIRPKYFNDESNYTEVFPKRIQEVLRTNKDARIFCVFDLDTVYNNNTRIQKHKVFEAKIKDEITAGNVTLCPSMPSIEYWFLLHFENYNGLLKNYKEVSAKLGPFMKACFPDSKKRLKTLLKKEKYLKDSLWVRNLCANGKLEAAIERAESNIKTLMNNHDLSEHSYSFIYKAFKVR